MKFLNSIYYKSLVALYKLNIDKDGRAKNIIINAIFEALIIGKDGLDSALLEMSLDTATNDWLDFWGNFFGVYRNYEEIDDRYRKRIIEEIISPKSTIPALKKATARYLKNNHDLELSEDSIKIFEPWTDLLKFDDRGVLDGNGRMISYDYWNYAVIDISIPDSTFITPKLINYLNKVKAGGVKIFFSIAPNWGIVVDPEFEEKRYNVWQKMNRQTFMKAIEHSEGFSLLLEGNLDNLEETDKGGILDSYGVLEGRQQIYWNGVSFIRSSYATGPIRNFFGSAVNSLEDYTKIYNKDLTIEELSVLEKESLEAPRTNESELTITQGNIEIKSIKTSKFYLLPYSKSRTDTIDFDDASILKLLDMDFIKELEKLEPNLTINEFKKILNNTNNNELLTKKVRSFFIRKIKEMNINESIQGPLIIKGEINEHSNI